MPKAKVKFSAYRGQNVNVDVSYRQGKTAIVMRSAAGTEIIRANLTKRDALNIARFLLNYGTN